MQNFPHLDSECSTLMSIKIKHVELQMKYRKIKKQAYEMIQNICEQQPIIEYERHWIE